MVRGDGAQVEPRGDLPPVELASALQDIAQHLYVSEDLEETLLQLTRLATQVIGGCEVASVSVVRDDGRLVTLAATEEVAHRLDDLQYGHGEGPCMDAAGDSRWVYTAHLSDDDRWPRFSRAVAEEFGMGSLLSCQLSRVDRPENRTGAINLYSRRPDAFTEADGMLGLLVGAHAGVLVDAARHDADLKRALASRDVIGQAKGILMAHREISEQEAFDQLVDVSQRFNIKLRDLAAMVSEATARGESPPLPEPGEDSATRSPHRSADTG